MGKLLGKNVPKIFSVNWFGTDDQGNLLWPGYGDNLRVLEWIINRCEGKVDAKESPVGFLPYEKDLNTKGLDLSSDALNKLLNINEKDWKQEVIKIKDFYKIFGTKLPYELEDQLSILEENLKSLN